MDATLVSGFKSTIWEASCPSDEFGIKIDYNKSKNAYYSDTEKSFEIYNFLQILNTAITFEILFESISRFKIVGN